MAKKKVLYVVEDIEAAQFRYRVKNIAEALEKSPDWRVEWVLKSKIDTMKLDEVSLIVILRQTAKDREILDFIKKAKNAGIKVLFDLDDLIFSYGDLPILMKSTNSKNIFYWTSYVWGIRRIAKKVDGFITTNNFLAKKLTNVFSRPCKVIPNSLNTKQVEIADKIIKNKNHDGFVIGYFSGSPTHTKDLRLIESEVFKFLDNHEDAVFKVVGYVEPSLEMKEKIKVDKVKILEFVNYTEQLKMMAKIDVNIAPLVINDFTNCKSELKFFEAAVVETITVASPTYTFKKAISNGENGFLAKPGEWYDKLEYLYNNQKENRKIAENARRYALDNYYGKNFLEVVEKAYNAFLSQ